MAADPPKIAHGEAVALVLGAGGARGLAQIGVIEALQERGLNIVAIAGSSSGALVGGLFASGQLAVFRDWLLAMSRSDMLRLLDPVFGHSALFGGDRLIQALRDRAGSPRIEDLPIGFTAVAVDLLRQREVWLRTGDLWSAVRASIAIPGLLTPHVVHDRELVDGGLLAPLPIAATRMSDAHRLIAVDMHGWPRRPPGTPTTLAPSGADRADTIAAEDPSRWARWLARRSGADSNAGDVRAVARQFGFTETMARALDTMQAQIARVHLALDPPELVIRIPRDACQFYEFWRARELIAIGRAEADKVLDAAGY